jgi:hypothetical protein
MTWRPQPGKLPEAGLFFAGALIGTWGPLQLEMGNLPASERGRASEAGGVFFIAVYLMAALFQLAQLRQVRRDLLFRRSSGVLGPIGGGLLGALVFYGVCCATARFDWLPALLVVLAAGCAIPYAASRALWRSREP